MKALKRILKFALAKAGYETFRVQDRYTQDGLCTVHNDQFRQDPEFRQAYERGVRASNGVDPGFEWRVHVALWAAARGLDVEGEFVECGVNAGFMSSAMMQRLQWNSRNRRFYLIDTFEGPVFGQYSETEIEKGRLAIAQRARAAGAYVTDMARVRANYAEWHGVVIVQGAVPDVLAAVDVRQVAFLHLDMNCAYPEAAALTFFWHRLSPGGVVLLDDFAYAGHEEQTWAIKAAAHELAVEILSLPTGQGLIVKPR